MKNCELAEFGSLARAMPSDAALEMRLIELGRQVGQVRAARAGSGRVAGLGHEAGNDAVEDEAVVELLLHQRLDLGDVLGRPVGPEQDHDLAVLRRHDDGVVGVAGGIGRRSGEER